MGKYASLVITSMLLLILIPVSALSNNQSIPINNNLSGFELEIKFEHDITYFDWLNLEQDGFVPLRQLTKNNMLVWANSNNYFTEDVFDYNVIKKSPDLLINEGNLRFSNYRVLLEPHLPTNGVVQVLDTLKNINLEINEYPAIQPVGSMPTSFEISGAMPLTLEIDGVWKIEEIKETFARNDVAASILESGSLNSHELWDRGLNGEGIIIAVADTGIDLDHSCFRENQTTVGAPGDDHRKIQLLNSTIDSWDSVNNSDFGHGTHIAGSLSCNWQDGELKEGSSLSYNSKLIVQDVVSEDGWEVPENVDVLFLEAAQNGALIHSDSWGDTEINYTKRSGDFDGWGREVPWSLIFVAPGNSGGQLMEPANARNVIAVGSTTKSDNLEMLSFSSIGPTNLGTRGIFLVAPGKHIISAKSDGVIDSLNNETMSLTGTSMSTPIAASGAAIIQQMVEEGLFSPNNQSVGFTPSGPLMKSLLALATTSVSNSNVPNPTQGWGVLNISEILPNDFFENNNSTIDNIWIWDSYQYEGDWSSFINSRINENSTPINSLTQNPWDGTGARGPFLSTGEEIRWNFTINREDDVEARLSWLAKPEPYLVDELELSIITSDGRIAYGNDFDENGFSPLHPSDYVGPSSGNETTVGINLDVDDLLGVDWIHVIVKGDYIGVGNSPGSVGIEGDRLGFGMSIKGVAEERDVELSGGGFEDIAVEYVLGYTYVGSGGVFEQVMFEDAKTLNWDFVNFPGNLAVELAIDFPRNISANLSNNPFGFRTITGLGEGAEVPICSIDNDVVSGVNSSARKWSIQGIWWPPALTDCKGNHMSFNLDSKRLDAPDPLKNWRLWVDENSGSDFAGVEMAWDLSSWVIPWVEGGVIPERMACEFKFENMMWQNCEIFMTDLILVPKNAMSMELRWSWTENGGLNRILSVEHSIPQFEISELPELSFDYSDIDENILSIRGDTSDDVLLVLFSESGEHAFVNTINKSWNLDETSMDCSRENYWIMGINSDEEYNFEIGNNALVYDDGNLSISALKINQSWEQKIENGQIIYLTLENKVDAHILSLPLKNFDLLELHGYCDENPSKTSNLALKGVFSMWAILSTIMLISGFLIWKKQQDLAKSGADEES